MSKTKLNTRIEETLDIRLINKLYNEFKIAEEKGQEELEKVLISNNRYAYYNRSKISNALDPDEYERRYLANRIARALYNMDCAKKKRK